jgi:hypothetical protein
MDRAQLRFILNSGPSRVFDVRMLHLENELEPFFRTSLLNNAILLKQSPPRDMTDWETLPPIATKIFLPYDRRKPEDGGESFFYTPGNLRGAIHNMLGAKNVKAEHLAADTEILTLLDRIPSFSPFLLKDIFERAQISIPDGYLTMPDREAAMIQQRMRARLRPLVATAFGARGGSISETSIERLVHKLWELKDMDGLQPLVDAFRITKQAAPEVFYCWLGIAFFENEYIKLQPRLKHMAHWISTKSTPRDVLPRGVLDHYMHSVALVRKILQSHWKRSLGILQEYTSTYDELVGSSGSAARFISFLKESRSHFWTLGGSLGRLEQSVEIWERICGRVNFEPLSFERGTELFGILNQVNSNSSKGMGEMALPNARAAGF